MGMFQRKPTLIEAEQYRKNGFRPKGMCTSNICCEGGTMPHVHTIHDDQVVFLEDGDWILPEPDGEHFYPCKPDIFEDTYDRVGD